MNGIFAHYLWTMFWGSVFWIMWFFHRHLFHSKNICPLLFLTKEEKGRRGHIFIEWNKCLWIFPRKYKYRCILFMLDLRMINMSSECEYDWYWKISACSTEYEVCDSFTSLTRHQTSYSGSTLKFFLPSFHICSPYWEI